MTATSVDEPVDDMWTIGMVLWRTSPSLWMAEKSRRLGSKPLVLRESEE
jgi:hypothetical protein